MSWPFKLAREPTFENRGSGSLSIRENKRQTGQPSVRIRVLKDRNATQTPGRQSRRRELTSSDCMVPAGQLAALGSTRRAATLLPGSHFRRDTNLSRESLNFPEALEVSGRNEHAQFCACFRLARGRLVSGFFCPSVADSTQVGLLCLCLWLLNVDSLQTSKKRGFFVLSNRRLAPEAPLCTRGDLMLIIAVPFLGCGCEPEAVSSYQPLGTSSSHLHSHFEIHTVVSLQ